MKKSKIITLLLLIAIMMTCFPIGTLQAKQKVHLSKTKLTITSGEEKEISLVNLKKKKNATWESSDTSVVVVEANEEKAENGKFAIIKAVGKEGTATITATVNKKKYKCTVKVKPVTIKDLRKQFLEEGEEAVRSQVLLESSVFETEYTGHCEDFDSDLRPRPLVETTGKYKTELLTINNTSKYNLACNIEISEIDSKGVTLNSGQTQVLVEAGKSSFMVIDEYHLDATGIQVKYALDHVNLIDYTPCEAEIDVEFEGQDEWGWDGNFIIRNNSQYDVNNLRILLSLKKGGKTVSVFEYRGRLKPNEATRKSFLMYFQDAVRIEDEEGNIISYDYVYKPIFDYDEIDVQYCCGEYETIA